MSIWQYSRGGDRAYRSQEEQKEPRGADHIGGVPEQEELSEHVGARGAIGGAIGAYQSKRSHRRTK